MGVDSACKTKDGNNLNYSIVSLSDNEDEMNVLRLKLRVSQKQKLKLIDSPKMKSKQKIEDDAVGEIDHLCNSIKNKVCLKTPVKRQLKVDHNEINNEDIMEISPSKKRTVEIKNSIRTPKSQNKKQQLMDEAESLIISGKRLRKPSSRFEIASPIKQNLDESFRKSILKCNLVNRFDESTKKQRELLSTPTKRKSTTNSPTKTCTPRRSCRRSFSKYFYDSEEEDLQMVEILKQTEKEAATSSTRALRSRSNSLADKKTSIRQQSPQTPSCRRSTRNCRSIYKNKSNNFDDVEIKTELKVLLEKIDILKTPTKTPKKTTVETPKTKKSTLKLLREGIITPSIHSRSKRLNKDDVLTMTPLSRARNRLHVSYMPTSLPCREKEYSDIYNFLKSKLNDGIGGCMYISGVPGTGKTATVTTVIDHMNLDPSVDNFIFININGMRLSEPRQAYVEIWKQLTQKTVTWEHAQSLLEERFTKKQNSTPIVMLIDELDILCTKRQDVVYNLLDWPTKSKQHLIVFTIANTMDLPERLLMNKVTSRLGLTRLTFQAYTYKQLVEIVMKRLSGEENFNSDAIQLVSRKVASVSGDARRALDICRRAAEIAEQNNYNQVTLNHVNEALTGMITQPQVLAIKMCSRLQQLILQAIASEFERTGVEETTFVDVYKMLINCCAIDRFKMVSSTAAQKAMYALSANRLIITDQKCSDIYQKIILNVSVHDIYFALKQN